MPFGGLLTVGLIGAGSTIGSSLIGSSASGKAANAQVKALQDLIARIGPAVTDAQKWESGAVEGAQGMVTGGVQSGQTRLDEALAKQLGGLAPYLKSGQIGTDGLAAGFADGGEFTKKFDPSTVQMDPGFDFRLKQGEIAQQRSAAARGGAMGGGAAKELARYAQDYSSGEYGKAYDRTFNTFETDQSNKFNRLSYLSNLGKSATDSADTAIGTNAALWSGLGMQGAEYNGNAAMRGAEYGGSTGMQGAQIIGNAIAGQGNAQAAGIMGGANAWSNGLGSISNMAQSLALMHMLQQNGDPTSTKAWDPFAPGSNGDYPGAN